MKRQIVQTIIKKFLPQSHRRENIRNWLCSDLTFDTVYKICKNNNINIKTIFDVGASDGSWSVAAQKKFKKSKFVLFEANTNYRKDLDNSGFEYFSYVLAQKTQERLFWKADGHGDSLYQDKSEKYKNIVPISVQAHALDDVIRENSIPIPDLLKIDTQGSEIEILLGAKGVLDEINFLYLECPIFNYNEGSPDISEYLRVTPAYNFIPCQIGEIHRTATNYLLQLDILFVKSNLIATNAY